MFPYARPKNLTEVNTFMSALGAGARSSVPRDHLTWSNFNPRATDAKDPARVHYYEPGNIDFGVLATYDFKENMFESGSWQFRAAEPAAWFHRIREDGAYLFDGDTMGFHQHSGAYRPFRLLDQIGKLTVEYGYARRHTALAILLYMSQAQLHNPFLMNEDFLPDFLEAADFAAYPKLTASQKVDAVNRDIKLGELKILLDQDMPYLLVKEMFPRY